MLADDMKTSKSVSSNYSKDTIDKEIAAGDSRRDSCNDLISTDQNTSSNQMEIISKLKVRTRKSSSSIFTSSMGILGRPGNSFILN